MADNSIISEKASEKQKQIIKQFSDFLIKLNKTIITSSGGSIGKVNDANLEFSIWRSLVDMEKEKTDERKHLVWAASLLKNVAISHPFTDGNKRTAYVAAKMVMSIDPVCPRYLKAPYGENTVKFIIKIAKGNVQPDEISKWLEKNSQKVTKENPELSKELKMFLDDLFELTRFKKV